MVETIGKLREDNLIPVSVEKPAFVNSGLADKLGLELVILNMDFDAVVSSVGKNNVDVAMAGLTVNETRKEMVDFTSSYYNAAQMVVVLKDDTSFDSCKTAADVEEVLKAL